MSRESVGGQTTPSSGTSKTIEIQSGVIIAAKFADKMRRKAFAIFKNDVPRNGILKATIDLNKRIYQKMVEAGIGKLDVVRIVVEARVEGCELIFGEPQIELFVPYSRVAELENELNSCRTHIKEMRSRLEEALKYTE